MINDSELKAYQVVLGELYSEVRHRRDFVLRIITIYAGLCGLVSGWVVGVSVPLGPSIRYGAAAIIVVLGIFVAVMSQMHWKAYAETARVIVKMSEKLGLFESVYPDNWRSWGRHTIKWPQLCVAFLSIASAIHILTWGLS
jgi:hypothetical protein